jgi:hypothetical protein
MKKQAVIGGLLALALAAFLAGRFSGASGRNDTTTGKRVLYYVDPMHPAYRSDKPGIAPDCGMPLVPVYAGEDPAIRLQLQPGAIYIDDRGFRANRGKELRVEIAPHDGPGESR